MSNATVDALTEAFTERHETVTVESLSAPHALLPLTGQPDFITSYADYADVFEMPRKAHEYVAIQLIGSNLNGNVSIPWGGVTLTLDQWVLLLSRSGEGRNTSTNVALNLIGQAGIQRLLFNATWGSSSAFYQQFVGHPRGLYVWQEFSAVLKKLNDSSFSGVKEWLTDRFDNMNIPPSITYRTTSRRQDTPPIVFPEAPRINILATSSRDWFINGLETADTTGGFIPRWLLVPLDGPHRLIPKPVPLNQELLPPLAEALRNISELRGEADLSDVERTYEAWYRAAYKRFEGQPNRGLALPFFNRMRGLVLKLAVIFQISQSQSLKVSEIAMRRAINAATEMEQALFEILPTGMNQEGSAVEKMAERIKSAAATGMLLSDVTVAFKHWKRNVRKDRLHTLYSSGTVGCFYRQTSGRRAQVFVHRDYLKDYEEQHPDDKPV